VSADAAATLAAWDAAKREREMAVALVDHWHAQQQRPASMA
jgi:hypothetical protein